MGLCVAVRFSPLLSLFRRGLRPPSLGRLSRPKCCPRMGLHQAPKLAGGMTSRMLGVPPARCRLRGSRGRTPGISAPVTRSAADKSGANPAPDGEFTHPIKSISCANGRVCCCWGRDWEAVRLEKGQTTRAGALTEEGSPWGRDETERRGRGASNVGGERAGVPGDASERGADERADGGAVRRRGRAVRRRRAREASGGTRRGT